MLNQSKNSKQKLYTVTHDSPVFFGKYKKGTHLQMSNDTKYCTWLLNTEANFAVESKAYLRTVGY